MLTTRSRGTYSLALSSIASVYLKLPPLLPRPRRFLKKIRQKRKEIKSEILFYINIVSNHGLGVLINAAHVIKSPLNGV